RGVNAAAEAFFSSLEWEVLARHEFTTTDQARAVVFDWCYGFYNHQRRHSSAGMKSPDQLREHRCYRPGSRITEPSTIPGEPQPRRSLRIGLVPACRPEGLSVHWLVATLVLAQLEHPKAA